MRFFVVMMRRMNTREAIAIFTDQEKAIAFPKDEFTTIEEHPLQGRYTYPNIVYVANSYDPGTDLFCFEGLFADPKAAKHASGLKGTTLSLIPDPGHE